MTDREKPKCPYCGKEMKASIIFMNGRWTGEYQCRACHAFAPSVDDFKTHHEAKEAAYEAAMKRPLRKPLTVEELFEIAHKENECDRTVWIEYATYGKTWRCWAEKPTEEEREAAEWET